MIFYWENFEPITDVWNLTSYFVNLRLHGKNSFTEVSKNLVRHRSENIFVIDHQYDYVTWNEAWVLMAMLSKVLTF